MLDCKNALVETDGDFDKAVEALRIKGAKDVGKRAERATAEGLVAAKGGALIELNSETDFVAKNAEFQELADKIVDAAVASKAADVDALKAASIGDQTVEEAIAALSAKIGEAGAAPGGAIRRHRRGLPAQAGRRPASRGGCARRVHGRQRRGGPRRRTADRRAQGALPVSRRRPGGRGGQRAPHRRGNRQGRGQARAGPAQDCRGRLNGFFKDAVLLEQPSVSDNKKTVKALLDEAGVTVTRFVRFEVGQA